MADEKRRGCLGSPVFALLLVVFLTAAGSVAVRGHSTERTDADVRVAAQETLIEMLEASDVAAQVYGEALKTPDTILRADKRQDLLTVVLANIGTWEAIEVRPCFQSWWALALASNLFYYEFILAYESDPSRARSAREAETYSWVLADGMAATIACEGGSDAG